LQACAYLTNQRIEDTWKKSGNTARNLRALRFAFTLPAGKTVFDSRSLGTAISRSPKVRAVDASWKKNPVGMRTLELQTELDAEKEYLRQYMSLPNDGVEKIEHDR